MLKVNNWEKTCKETWNNVFENSTLDYNQERKPTEFVKQYVSLLKKHRVKKVLDAGCGDGRNLIFLAKQGFFVVGCDISEIALEKAAKNAKIDFVGVIPRNIPTSKLRNSFEYLGADKIVNDVYEIIDVIK